MSDKEASGRRGQRRRFYRWFYIYAIIWVPIAAAYLALFLVNPRADLSTIAASLVSNIVFPFVFGLAVYALILRWLVREPYWIQAVAHLTGSVAFSMLWANALFRALQLIKGLASGDWSFEGFTGAALLWQMFQGVTLYFMIAAGAYAVWFYDRLQQVLSAAENGTEARHAPPETAPNILSRFFARSGDDIMPVDVEDIIIISGADDYAEFLTSNGKGLARQTLKELESRLDPAKFLRVHRSYIVNIDKVASIEPAGGGRLSVHMQGGETVTASRSGAQKLRERLI